MGTISEGLPEKDAVAEMACASMATEPPPLRAATPSRQSLPPKGSCWYCEKPLDSVKRFCGKGCADAFDEEAEFTR
ncbi:hypothetical protein [Pseudoduganella sp. GCM10020061]|uniref:hypothetical protein n=1 Tax=Pseudoduganella sp. GCM10020061 TaxID=3317345 RepID=UPI00362ABF63